MVERNIRFEIHDDALHKQLHGCISLLDARGHRTRAHLAVDQIVGIEILRIADPGTGADDVGEQRIPLLFP